MWTSSTLLVSAGLIFMLSWPVQDALRDVVAGQARTGGSDGLFAGTQQLVAARLVEVAVEVVDEIVRDVRLYSLVLAVAAAVVLLVGVFWDRGLKAPNRSSNLSPGGGVR